MELGQEYLLRRISLSKELMFVKSVSTVSDHWEAPTNDNYHNVQKIHSSQYNHTTDRSGYKYSYPHIYYK